MDLLLDSDTTEAVLPVPEAESSNQLDGRSANNLEKGGGQEAYGGGLELPWTGRVPQAQWDGLYDGGSNYSSTAFGGQLGGFFAVMRADPGNDVEEVVVTGVRQLYEYEIARFLAKFSDSLYDSNAFMLSQLVGDVAYDYVIGSQVGDTECDADEAWTGLLEGGAPGQIGTSYNGKIVNIPGLGEVMQEVDYENKIVRNIALPGHLFFPAVIERSVIVESSGKVSIATTGYGTTTLGQLASYLAPLAWHPLDEEIAEYVDANDDGPDDNC